MEVTYARVKSPVVEKTSSQIPQELSRTLVPKAEILTPQSTKTPRLLKGLTSSAGKQKIHSKQQSKIDLLKMKRAVSVSFLKSEKMMGPKYLDYANKIRPKIKDRVNSYINRPDIEGGKVYLTFVLLNNGTLKEIKIIDEKTKSNNFLKTVGLKSVKESSPFPAFPKDFNYPEISFGVEIIVNGE